MRKLLKNRLFMIGFASDMLSNFGDVMYYLALMAYVLQLPDPKLAIALVSVSETLPILTGFVMGYWADRTPDKVKTILQTLLFRVFLYVLVGFVMGFEPGLWVVLVASVINFLSDISGQYENGLFTPLSLRIVSDEDRSDSFAFRQAVASILNIGFQSVGAVLVSLMTYQALAFVNAATFALSALILFTIRSSLEKLLLDRPIQQVEESGNQTLFKDLWSSMRGAIRECMRIPEIRKSLVILPLLNGIFSVVSTLIAVIISQDQDFVVINPVTTLALLTTCELVGAIIGSVLAMNVLKGLDIVTALRLATIFVPIFFVLLYIHHIYGILLVIFLTMILAGAINPKLNALILNRLPEEKMAMIVGGISTYFQLGIILLRLLVSGLILMLPADWISLVFLIFGLYLVFYAFRGKNVSKI